MLLLKEEWDIDFLGGKFVSDVAEPPHISSFSVMFSLAENCKQSETILKYYYINERMITMKKIIFGALLGIMMIIPIATTNTISEAKTNKPTGKIIDYSQKKSKKVCKASNIKLYFDNEKQRMRIKSFKKSKYLELSKKQFEKTLDVISDKVFQTFYVDGKKYKTADVDDKCCWAFTSTPYNSLYDTSISNIIKVAKPGVHTIKIRVGVINWAKEKEYSFWYTGKINIKKKTDWYAWYKKQKVTYDHDSNSRLFSIESVVPNFNAKMEVNVKYIFDKAHYIKDSERLKYAKDNFNLKTDADVYNFIHERVGKDLTITESVNVNKNRKDVFDPIKIDISKNAAAIKTEKDLYSYDITFPSGCVLTEEVFDKDISIWDAFRPEVTVKFYDRENGEYVSEFTRTVKDVYVYSC